MNDKNLIDELVSTHSKITPVTSVKMRFIKWLLVCGLCLGAGISMLGLREDWATLFTSPILLVQNIFILMGVFIAGIFAINLSVPDTANKKSGISLLYILAGVWTLILFSIGLLNHTSLDELSKFGFGCIRDIVIIGIIPGATLFAYVRQGVVLEQKLAGAISMIAAFGIGAFGVQYTCHNDGALHILVWHFLPILILGGSGVMIGKKFIKKL